MRLLHQTLLFVFVAWVYGLFFVWILDKFNLVPEANLASDP
jgi:hypothetical protein